MNLSTIFNTRELAYIIWGIFFLVFGLVHKDLKKDFLPLLIQLFDRRFISIYLSTIAYVCGCSTLLFQLKFWEISMIKDTILWIIFAALPMLFKVSRAKDLKVYFKSTLAELFQITVVTEFIIGIYTVSIWVELALVPVVGMLAGLIIYSKDDPKNSKAHKLFKWISIGLGIYLMLNELYHILNNVAEYLQISYLKQFILPIALSLLLAPYLYFFAAYVRFEETFTVMKLRIKESKVFRSTRIHLLRHFFNNIEGLGRWRIHIFKTHPETEEQILQSIYFIKQIQEAEKLREFVDPSKGWSPYIAKDFLKHKGINTDFYQFRYEDEWGISSNIKRLDNNTLGPSVVYDITGTKTVVTKLRLVFGVHKEYDLVNSRNLFYNYVSELYLRTVNEPPPLTLRKAILAGKRYQSKAGLLTISTSLKPYINKLSGFDIKFIITHAAHVEC